MEPAKDIALLMPHNQRLAPYFVRALNTVQAAASARGCQCHLLREDEVQQRMRDPVWRGRLDQPVAGIIIYSPYVFDYDSYLRLFIKQKYPCVLVRRKTQVPGVVTLLDDDDAGARLALEHLYGLGHRVIGYFMRTSRLYGAERRQACSRFMQQHGLPVGQQFIFSQPQSLALPQWREKFNAWLETLRTSPNAPTAFLCYCDEDAKYLIHELERAGKQVPRDAAVVGYNDDPVARTCQPPLTTVRTQVEEMCAEACRLIVEEKIAASPSEVLFPHTLVVRESCGASTQKKPVNGGPYEEK